MASPKPVTSGSVKVVKKTSATSRANKNFDASISASRAKSGRTAKESAELINNQNSLNKAVGWSKSKTVKINSGTKTARTPMKPKAKPTTRRGGGLRGGGLNIGDVQK